MHRIEQRWPLLIFVLGASFALLWPAFVNGQPFIFSDTTNYVRGMDAAAYRLTGIRSGWTDEFVTRYAYLGADLVPRRPRASTGVLPVTLAGRSIYYGALLYLSQAVYGFWLAALVQAVLTAFAVLFTWERLVRPRGPVRHYGGAFLVVVFLAALTPVAYFVSFAMPDIFAPLGLLAFAHLASFASRDDRARRLFWFSLLSFALLAHSANILLACLLFLLLLVASQLRRVPFRPAALSIIMLAIMVGIGGEALFSWAVRDLTGAAPIRPPFLMARIIDDGPGYRFLRGTCPANGFSVCRYLPILPLNSDAFLWEKERGKGVFQASSPVEQRALAKEEPAFVIATARARPLDLARSAVRSTIAQMSLMGLPEFNNRQRALSSLHEKLPAAEAKRQAGTAAVRGVMVTQPIAEITPALAGISLGLLLLTFACPTMRLGESMGCTGFAIIILAGIFLNDVITGTMSTPHDRYQSRIIWLLPLLASCALPHVLDAGRRWRRRAGRRVPLAAD